MDMAASVVPGMPPCSSSSSSAAAARLFFACSSATTSSSSSSSSSRPRCRCSAELGPRALLGELSSPSNRVRVLQGARSEQSEWTRIRSGRSGRVGPAVRATTGGDLRKSSSLTQMSPPVCGRSRYFAGAGMMSSREAGVSTSGRAPAIRIGSGRGSSSSSGNGNRLQSKSKSNAGPDVLPSLNPKETEATAAFVARDQSLEAPSPYPEGDGDVDLDVTEAAGAQESFENENSLGTMEERLDALAAKKNKTTEEVMVRLGEDPSLPTMENIIATAAQEGVKLQVKTFGPTFQIVVTNLDETHTYGKADGWIKWWWPKGKILHLESVKLERGLSKQVGNIGGAGFFVGAATLRYGFDQGCRTAELLAIYDDEATHSKLVKYYSRFGFKTLYEVNEEELKYFPDRVVWGGQGTRMDAHVEELLRKWSAVLKPRARSGFSTKGFFPRS